MRRNWNEINVGLRFKYIHDAVEKIGNQNSKKSDLTFSQVHVICFFCESHEKSISLKDLENEFNLSHPTIYFRYYPKWPHDLSGSSQF